MIYKVLVIASILLIFSTISAQTLSDIIVPLKSKRTEVERVLGPPLEVGCTTCFYETSTAKVKVDYSIGKCKGSLKGWNVPLDTVLSFTLDTFDKKKFVELGVSKNDLLGFITDDLTSYRIDIKNGTKYTINPLGILEKITYLPTENNQYLHCRGFPKYSVAGTVYIPISRDRFSNIGELKLQINKVVDSFADENIKIYVNLYLGDDLKSAKYKKILGQFKNYIFNERKIPAKFVLLTDGGRREKSTVEIFVLPSTYPAPTATPDFASK
jgi:hypothetical protein